MANKEIGEFDLSELFLEEDEKNHQINVRTTGHWKEWIPEKFWGVITTQGIDRDKFREIIENELKKEKELSE